MSRAEKAAAYSVLLIIVSISFVALAWGLNGLAIVALWFCVLVGVVALSGAVFMIFLLIYEVYFNG